MTATRTPRTARKGRPTADDARKKMAHVVAVASQQFSELGYRAVTMRGVAEKARVSTRTLYNRYADKLSLFTACLDFKSDVFPVPDPAPGESPDRVLERYAAAIVRALSSHGSLRMGLMVYRDGLEFPEILRAAEAHENRRLIQPLSAYLRQAGLQPEPGDERAKLFLAMALAQWRRQGSYRHPPPQEPEIVRHAAFVVRTFLEGVRALDGKPVP
jgi:AcrR family transcriptional regulator